MIHYIKNMSDNLIKIALITSSHGLKGAVKIKTFTEKATDLLSYGSLIDKKNIEYHIEILSVLPRNIVIAKIANIDDRCMADRLSNTKLYIKKSQLPTIDAEDTFYAADLIEMQLKLPDKSLYGHIKDIKTFNSCDVVEVRLNNDKITLLPFSQDIFSEVNLKEKYAILQLPEIIE